MHSPLCSAVRQHRPIRNPSGQQFRLSHNFPLAGNRWKPTQEAPPPPTKCQVYHVKTQHTPVLNVHRSRGAAFALLEGMREFCKEKFCKLLSKHAKGVPYFQRSHWSRWGTWDFTWHQKPLKQFLCLTVPPGSSLGRLHRCRDVVVSLICPSVDFFVSAGEIISTIFLDAYHDVRGLRATSSGKNSFFKKKVPGTNSLSNLLESEQFARKWAICSEVSNLLGSEQFARKWAVCSEVSNLLTSEQFAREQIFSGTKKLVIMQ